MLYWNSGEGEWLGKCLPNLQNNEMVAPVSAHLYVSSKSATTSTTAVWTLVRLSLEDESYLSMIKDFSLFVVLIHFILSDHRSYSQSCPHGRCSHQDLKQMRIYTVTYKIQTIMLMPIFFECIKRICLIWRPFAFENHTAETRIFEQMSWIT